MTLSHTNQVTADWSERGGYMLARHGIHPAWANEALDDPDRLVITPDPASKSGRAVRTIGWSYTANRIITRDHARRQRPAPWRERMGGKQQ